MLRLPDGMRDALKAAATDNNRSLNAEIVSRLEAYGEILEQNSIAHAQITLRDKELERLSVELERLQKKLEQEVVVLSEEEREWFGFHIDWGHETLTEGVVHLAKEAVSARRALNQTSANPSDYLEIIEQRLDEISTALWSLKHLKATNDTESSE